jgi:hypothetical protein
VVGTDDVVDDDLVEGFAGAAGQAAGVEDVGDLSGGVLVEQGVDGGADLGRGAALVSEQRRWDGEGVVLAAGQADVRGGRCRARL